MGKGSFGQVLRCFDHHTGKTVAVKIIRNKRQFHAQALVEVKILQDLLEWDPDDKYNNVRIQEKFEFRNHLCIVFECLNINLYEYIKSNGFKGSSMGLVKRFAVQLLNSLALLRQHKLIHCDLKPENILLKHPTKSAIKVIDFGSSCLENQKGIFFSKKKKVYMWDDDYYLFIFFVYFFLYMKFLVYSYIQSRFYRSPEVILGLSYSMAIDMWSLGCILAEIYTGCPLFPGENEQDQFATIMEIQGIPDKTLLEKSTRKKLFFGKRYIIS
jgi:dual specificity tyrosine-phosphorylation-regulated kinase 2/3/4